MSSGVAIALVILYYSMMRGQINGLEQRLSRVEQALHRKGYGLSYDGLGFPDGPLPALNLSRYQAALVEHEAATSRWLEGNPHLEKPELSRQEQIRFWCQRNLATARKWTLVMTFSILALWLVSMLWPLAAQFLFGTTYDYNNNVVPHHTPHVVVLMALIMTVALLVVGAVALAMVELAGRMTEAMTTWCQWKAREDEIAWHQTKLSAVSDERARVEQDLADLRALSQD